MSDQLYYQYAFALPDCSLREIGPGVDPRFPVELLPSGPVAAVVSRVQWDQSDLRKLQAGSVEDIAWLKRVGVRHHEITCQVAKSSPVLPLRLGTLFGSQASLLAAMLRCRATVADFLNTLADRQEWAVRLYLSSPSLGEGVANERLAEKIVAGEGVAGEGVAGAGVAGAGVAGVERSEPPDPRHSGASLALDPAHPKLALDPAHPPSPPHRAPVGGAGTNYLKRKQAELQRRRELEAALPAEIQAVEDRLKVRAERCCRVRTWPTGLSGRREKMVFNAAFLLSSSETQTWLATVGETRQSVRCKGLLLEVTGPWPPYHFCPQQLLIADC